jgi:hypothetical protein
VLRCPATRGAAPRGPFSCRWKNPARPDTHRIPRTSRPSPLVGGGYNYTYAAYASVDIFDVATDTWTYAHSGATTASMNEPRGDFSFVEVDNKFYAYGGWVRQSFDATSSSSPTNRIKPAPNQHQTRTKRTLTLAPQSPSPPPSVAQRLVQPAQFVRGLRPERGHLDRHLGPPGRARRQGVRCAQRSHLRHRR